MTEFLTYKTSYTEFLVPGYSNLKVCLHSNGNMDIEDMGTNETLVMMSNVDSTTVYDLADKVNELSEELRVAKDGLAFWKKCSELWKRETDRKIKEVKKLNEAYLKEVDKTDRLAKWLNGDDAWLYKIANIIDAWSWEVQSDERIEQ